VEAQAIARMNHPNIVGIHNFGMHDGRPFYVMDLLKGNSLAERLKKGLVPTALGTSEETQKASEVKRNVALAVVAITACTLIVASLAFLAISGTASIPALTKLFVGQKDFSTSKVESKINETAANSDKFLQEDQNRITGPICKYERKNKKLFKVFNFPQMVFGMIYSESSGRMPERAYGRLEYAADDQIIFAARNKMMTHPENFKAIGNGDFDGIHLLYLAEGKPAKEDSMVPAPEAVMSDISASLRNMAHLNKLKNLSLAHCTQLKDSDIAPLDHFPHLNALDLTNTNAKGSEVAKLKCIKQMRNLDFTACRQITPLLRTLAGSKNLLWLKASELTDGPLSKGDLSNIARLTNLEKLELNGVGINNEAIETLSLLPKLRKLSAHMGTVDRRALKTMKKMKALESADLKNPLWLGRYESDKQKPGSR
jgi:hypothetical protein